MGGAVNNTPQEFMDIVLGEIEAGQQVIIEHALILDHPMPRDFYPNMLQLEWREEVNRLAVAAQLTSDHGRYFRGSKRDMFTCYPPGQGGSMARVGDC